MPAEGWRRSGPNRPWRSARWPRIRPWTTPSTADGEKPANASARVIHPFHPLRGKAFRVLAAKLCWGRDYVFVEGPDGRVLALPSDWTDHAPQDPFLAIGAGRCQFAPADLLALAELLEGIDQGPSCRKEM